MARIPMGRLDRLDRRSFLELSGAGAAALIFGAGPYTGRAAAGPRRPADYPFKLGVASGDPAPDGVVLWTRLAPDPLDTDPATPGGMSPRPVPVQWEVAEDERFARVVRRSATAARPELGHSVHAEVTGLRPGREYFYRFRAAGEISPVGRTKTAPSGGADRLRFAFVSCQQFEHGHFTAYRHLAADDLDVVFHLGDYIYEYGPDEFLSPTGNIRHHLGPEITTLADYRLRHAQYRTDPDLRAAHAHAPWVVTWDDHEVENNYADHISENAGEDPAAFLRRRAAAYQAYYENMPLRRASVPRGPDMQLFRRVGYGSLADFHVLDTRQYRSDQAAGDGNDPPNPEQQDPARSLTGAAQERWLLNGMTRSRARWQVIPQQVFFAQRDLAGGAAERYSMDAWDGYVGSRDRIMRAIQTRDIRNVVVLTGDVHASWACELKADWRNPASRTLGVELVGTSVTSGGNGSDVRSDTATILGENPHIKFFNNYRGYVRCTVTRDDLRADYRVVPTVTEPGAPVFTRATFRTAAGRPGLERIADNPLPTGTGRATRAETEQTRVKAQGRAAAR
ncbi:MAG TPA: alkaline phosphatase D family protein [Streptosporangiaceae bacterium]|nr:alkaline phosphatase D family protein [Streptosporangiaceae bacterium]